MGYLACGCDYANRVAAAKRAAGFDGRSVYIWLRVILTFGASSNDLNKWQSSGDLKLKGIEYGIRIDAHANNIVIVHRIERVRLAFWWRSNAALSNESGQFVLY